MIRIPPALRPVLPYGLFAVSVLLLLYHHLSEPIRVAELNQIAALEQRPVNGRFPSWYGQPDVVGPSPYDWVARWEPKEVVGARGGQGGRKRRILFLTDYHDYLERMDTVIFEVVDAALRHPALLPVVWGPGWKGWDASKSVSANVNGKWGGCGYFDVMWTFAWLLKKEDPLMDAPGCETLFIHQLGDCHDGTPDGSCMQDWFPYQSNITLSRYAFELSEVFTHERIMKNFPGMAMHLFAHSPDAANPWDFFPLNNWRDKKQDAVLFGFEGDFYPLRSTISRAIQDQTTSIVVRHPHPGYGVSYPDSAMTNPEESYDVTSPLHASHRAIRADFARGMREARICVFDSSVERKMIRKYAQAMLSGCVIAGDVPTEMEDELKSFMVVLQPWWSIAQIDEVIATALRDPAELQRKALSAFAFARTHLTNLRKVDKAVMPHGFAGDYARGERGYKFPYGFSMRCRSYWNNAGGFRPSWCGNRLLGLEGPETYAV